RGRARRHCPARSPATRRNVMADLEDAGYLAQPHASAGRVPTDKAYRLYVDSFPKPSTNPRVADARARGSGIDSYMERTSNHLSAVTKMTGLLLAPPLKRTTIARVELVPLEEHRALAVLVTDSGWVPARPLTLDPPLPADGVRKLGPELTRRFGVPPATQIIAMATTPADPL